MQSWSTSNLTLGKIRWSWAMSRLFNLLMTRSMMMMSRSDPSRRKEEHGRWRGFNRWSGWAGGCRSCPTGRCGSTSAARSRRSWRPKCTGLRRRWANREKKTETNHFIKLTGSGRASTSLTQSSHLFLDAGRDRADDEGDEANELHHEQNQSHD